MNKSLLVALAFGGAVLTGCSSHPSDFRPDNKVSNDHVPPGTRDTDYTNFGGGHEGAHDHEGAAHEDNAREDVMLNHDAGSNKIGHETEQVDPKDKTTQVDSVENHE